MLFSGFETSPWAGQDESAVTAGLGPQVPNVLTRGQKEWSRKSPAALHRTEAQAAAAAEPWDAATSAAAPFPQSCSILLREEAVAPAAVGGRKSAAQLLLCRGLSVLACTVVAIVQYCFFPASSSHPVETGGKTPRSHFVMAICRCERAAASLSRCCAWREGSCKQTAVPRVPSGACCCGRATSPAASQPGSLAAGFVLWDLTGMVRCLPKLLNSWQKALGVRWLLMDVLADRQMSNLSPPDQSESTSFSSSTWLEIG